MTVLSYQQSSSSCFAPTSHTPRSHNALCLHNRDEGLCVFVLEASIFRAQSGFSFSNIKNSHRKLHGCHPEPVISINYSPPRASQGPCIEPDGQQSTPCGSTTVQRPMLTGKRVVGAVVKHLTQAGLPRSALSPHPKQLRATQGRLKRCSNPPTWAAATLHFHSGQQGFICMFCT